MTRNHRGIGAHLEVVSGVDADFYTHHVRHVRRRLRRMGIFGADVDDLVQQTFIVAQNRWTECPLEYGRQRKWLRGIAWRLGMNLLRRNRHHHELFESEVLSSLAATEPGAEDRANVRQVFAAAFAGVTAEDRQMFFGYFCDEVSLSEIAARHGLARSTAWSRLQKLKREAAERLALFMA